MATAVVLFEAVAVAVATIGVEVDGIGRRLTSSQLEIAGPRIRATRSAPTGRFSVSVVHQMIRMKKAVGFATNSTIGYCSLNKRAGCSASAVYGKRSRPSAS